MSQSFALSGLTLPAGGYWLSLVAVGPDVDWSWPLVIPVRGDPAVSQNPGGGYPSCPTTFKPLGTGCGASAAGHDLSFRIEGDAIVTPAKKKCKKHKKKHASAAKTKRCKKKKR